MHLMHRAPATANRFLRIAAVSTAFCALALPARALERCEVGGQDVNPNNGNTTQGKTGLMRCKDADSGQLVREQELQNGKFMGIVRRYEAGQLVREHSVNERGNRDGVAREWQLSPSGTRVLVREETLRNGSSVGIVRSWHPNGQRRRVTFYSEEPGERELAYAEFTPEGKLSDLRCTTRPVLGPDFDDKAACGFAGAATVVFFSGKGTPVQRIVFERGERRKSETLFDSGAVRELRETNADGGVERVFAADGIKRREVQWVAVAGEKPLAAGERPRRVTTLEQEFHESGKLIRERRWKPTERGAELVSDATWYLNGQQKSRTEYGSSAAAAGAEPRATRRESGFHDNGKPASEGTWVLAPRAGRSDYGGSPVGVHRHFDEQGRARGERYYDDRGRVVRERELDESGRATRDDEVFEDGSRKAYGR